MSNYNDVKNTDWSKQYVDFVTNNGLMNGYAQDNQILFKPKNNITREEIAVVICNLVNYFKKN